MVSYAPPPINGIIESIDVPVSDLTVDTPAVESVGVPLKLTPGQGLRFSGRIRVKEPHRPGMAHVRFYWTMADGKRVVMAEKIEQCISAEDGCVKFIVELKGPSREACRYEVELFYLMGGDNVQTIARGETEIP